MKKLLIFLILTFQINGSFACCGAGKYKVFPLGESNGRIVMVSFDLGRKCERGRMFEEYHWKGKVKLNYFQGDTLELISILDTLDFFQTNDRDSNINYLKQFYDSIIPYYQKALKQARKLKNFKEAKLISYEYHEDTLPINNISIINDTVLLVDNVEIKLFPLFWGSCGYYNDITSLRVYKINNEKLRILTIACNRYKFISDEIIEFNFLNFKSIEKAYVVDKVEWHGENYDYIIQD